MRSKEQLERIQKEARQAADRDWLRARDLVTALLRGFGPTKPDGERNG